MNIYEEHSQIGEKLVQGNNEIYFRFHAATFIIQHNLPFILAEKLLSFVQLVTNNHNVEALKNYTLNANHISQIASRCIESDLQAKYLNLLKRSPFSIALDETSSCNNEEFVAINARLLQEDSYLPTTKLIALLKIEESSTGENLYNLVHDFLFSGQKETKERRIL